MSNTQIDLEGIGMRLKTIRKEMRKTQQDIADDLGTSKSYISEAEHGKKMAGTHFFILLMEKYGVNTNYLFTGDGPMFLNKQDNILTQMDFERDQDHVIDMLKTMHDNPSIKYFLFAYYAEIKARNKEI